MAKEYFLKLVSDRPKGKVKHIYTAKGLDLDVKLWQRSKNYFAVSYGLQVKDGLTYSEAMEELGACIMHSATCAGMMEY